MSLRLRCPLDQPRRLHPLGPRAERFRRPLPLQHIDVAKERRVGSQRREILEEQGVVAVVAQDLVGQLLDRAVLVQSRAAVTAPMPGMPG